MRRAFPILLLLSLAALPLAAQTAGCESYDLSAAAAGRLPKAPPKDGKLADCLLRRYVIAKYGERMVRDLQEMVGFQTFEVEGKENWDLPEFVRQRDWLRRRAGELGLEFKSYDGRVEELTLPGPKPVLALLTHGDVQGVEGQQWSSPPFEGKLVNGRIIGRGTEDDKGPIVASLYLLATLRESGWPRAMTIRLLVANGEESSWAEIPYYLARASMPDVTIGVDAAYPVTHSQKGYGIVTFRARPAAEPKPAAWRVVKMSGGSGMSIIAERGEALLERTGTPAERAGAFDELSRLTTSWVKSHAPAKLTVTREGDLLKLTAEGRGGHSSAPESGHNALGDLTAFLATLDLRMDAWGALAAFTGVAAGTETDARSLGLAHRDAVMGELTSNLSFLREDHGAPVSQINIRYPRGIGKPEMEAALAERTAAFTRRTGATIEAGVELSSQPHLAPAEGELVTKLLDSWKEVTGKTGKPIAIGGGTQARLFKGGVDFGPAEDMVHYRGHGTDEYLTPEELRRIAELTITAVWKVAGKP